MAFIARYYSMLFAKDGRLYRYTRNSLLFLAILFVVVITFVMQNKEVGFEQGHHGYVSAQTLAIISNATFDNQFVGYTLASKDDSNKVRYEYFDRYPVFFSALFNIILSSSSDLATKVYIARQVMNCIFLGILVISFLLVRKFIENKYLALSVVLICFSNFYLLYYKDMVHFDQPALLGFVLLLFCIAIYKLEGKRKPLYWAAFISVGLGRGYASYAIMGLWVGIEFIMFVKSSNLHLGEAFKKILKHDSFRILIIGLVWGTSLLAYNVVIEAKRNEVPLTQTSIVDSALKRLSLNEQFNEQYAGELDWARFIPGQFERIAYFSIPVGQDQLKSYKYVVLLPLVVLALVFIKRADSNKRLILLLMALSGFVWLFPMRNLAAFHDYTAMYYIGVPLVLYMALLSPLKRLGKVTIGLCVACIAFYAVVNSGVSQLHSSRQKASNAYTVDFNRIAQTIGEGKNVYIKDGYSRLVPGVAHALGFYLAGDYFTSSKNASDYVISTDKHYQSETLTPSNKKVFLFARQTAQRN